MSDTLPPCPSLVSTQVAAAAYAVLRARNLITAHDWSIPLEIGAEVQALWEKTEDAGRKSDLRWLVNRPYVGDPLQPWAVPSFPNGPTVTCSKCGMKWEGAMGYVCPDAVCPVQPKVSY